jgi:hypothetical protein
MPTTIIEVCSRKGLRVQVDLRRGNWLQQEQWDGVLRFPHATPPAEAAPSGTPSSAGAGGSVGAGGSAGAGECLGDEVVAADDAEIVRERGAYGDGHVVKAATEKLKAFGGVGGLLAKFYESSNDKSERDALKQVMLIRISLRLRTA